jgi:YihY family inner membrane protein
MKTTLIQIGRAFAGASRMLFSYDSPRDAASISYFSLFALFPATLVLIAVVDAFLGWLELHRTVEQKIISLFPASRAFLSETLAEITHPAPALVLSCVVAVVWSSTWVFTVVENALNRVWDVPRRRTFWESRVRSIALLLIGGTLLLLSAGITAVVSVARSLASERVQLARGEQIIDWIWSSILLGAGFLIAVIVFWFVYKLMPDRKVPWLEALSGALVAAVLWEAASYIFVKLAPFFDYDRVYGRTGAIIAVLTWVYTSNLIMLFGAAFSARLHQPQQKAPSAPTKTPDRHPRDKVRTFPHRH